MARNEPDLPHESPGSPPPRPPRTERQYTERQPADPPPLAPPPTNPPPMDLPPLVDHHCHGVLLHEPASPAAYETLLTESPHPPAPGTSHFDTQTGFAVRRWCAPLLDLSPHCPPSHYLARRAELGEAEVRRRLLRGAGVSTFLVDTGLPGPLTTPEQTASAAGGTGHEVVRLESLAERIAQRSATAEEFMVRVAAAMGEAARSAIGFKSIAAYRHGLALAPEPPTREAVRRAAHRWLSGAGVRSRSDASTARLSDPVIIRHLLWLAVAAGRPLQIHTGFGDPDLRLDHADPALLTDFVRATAGTGAHLILLHGYPYHRQAAYLASVFPHVYADIGLALAHTGTRSTSVLAEFLELTPFGKLLFSTDAYGLPELYTVGAALFRSALGEILGTWVRSGAWSAADAGRVAALIAADNARRVYGLPSASTAASTSPPGAATGP